MANKLQRQMAAICAHVKGQEVLHVQTTHVGVYAMVSPCLLTNKFLLVMAAIHAHVKDLVVLHVHQTHVDAPTKVEP